MRTEGQWIILWRLTGEAGSVLRAFAGGVRPDGPGRFRRAYAGWAGWAVGSVLLGCGRSSQTGVDSVIPELPGICGGPPINEPGRGANGSWEGSVDPGRAYPTKDQWRQPGAADGRKDPVIPMGV